MLWKDRRQSTSAEDLQFLLTPCAEKNIIQSRQRPLLKSLVTYKVFKKASVEKVDSHSTESNHQQTNRKEIAHGKKSTSYNAPQCIRNETLCRKGQQGSFQRHSDLQTCTWPGYQAQEQEGKIDFHYGHIIQKPSLVRWMAGLRKTLHGGIRVLDGFPRV